VVEGNQFMIRSKLLISVMCGAMLAIGGMATAASAVVPTPTTIDCTYGGVGCPTTPPVTTGTTAPGTTVPGTVPTYTVVLGATTSITPKVVCPVGSNLVVTYNGSDLGSYVVNANGTVGPITIPARSTIGTNAVRGSCAGAAPVVIANIQVVAAAVTNTTPPSVNNGVLARTGLDNTGPLVGIGLAVIVLGAAFVYGSRKPRLTD
jgi:hypothetical protein